MRLLRFEQLACDYHAWGKMPYTGPEQRGNQRFGQYVWNRYSWPGRESWPQLFYCGDTMRAYNMLLEYLQEVQDEANASNANAEAEVRSDSGRSAEEKKAP